MPKLTIGGEEVTGVMKADVQILHDTLREPARVPLMEWNVIIGLQDKDMLAKWALAAQDVARFKRCELVVYNRDKSQAHTWVILKAYVHEYMETEFPAEGVPGDTADAGNYIKMKIRGTLLHPEDYNGENVMTVAPGEAEAKPG